MRAEFPEYAAVHSYVLQDVLARLDTTTYKEHGNGARLDTGYLMLSKLGRIAVRWSRPLEGTLKTVTVSREADGW
jgi:putative transposase